MTTSRLLSLPPELQTAITSWLFRPSHVAQICLVCKQLRSIAMPQLYRDFAINVDEWSQDEIDRFVTRGHAGHRLIRSLDVDSSNLDTEDVAMKVAKDLLQVLPRNLLRSFRYGKMLD